MHFKSVAEVYSGWSPFTCAPIHTHAGAGACAGSASEHHRKHALSLLHSCAVAVLSMRTPEDSSLPGIARDKLATMLFGDAPPPQVMLKQDSNL